jgi:recombinational DNA repair protein RecR
VFDITVPKLHNFIANDIILENSIEQDSDVVMLLYREDKYRKTTENANVAEVIIAKHRNGATGSVKLYFEDKCASFRNLETTNISSDFNAPDENLDYNSFVPPENQSADNEYGPTPEELEKEEDIDFSDN